jgi:hypothetical protein
MVPNKKILASSSSPNKGAHETLADYKRQLRDCYSNWIVILRSMRLSAKVDLACDGEEKQPGLRAQNTHSQLL